LVDIAGYLVSLLGLMGIESILQSAGKILVKPGIINYFNVGSTV